MPNPKGKPKGGMEWFTGLLEHTDPTLDHLREYRANLQKQGQLGKLAVNEYDNFEKIMKKELLETKATKEQREEILSNLRAKWAKIQAPAKAAEIRGSTELAQLDRFITGDVEKYPKLLEIINSSEPKAKWEVMVAGFTGEVPGLGDNLKEYFGPVLAGFGLDFLISDEDEKGEKKSKKDKKDKKNKKKKAEAAEGPEETHADMPENWVPKEKALIMGDSNLANNKDLIFDKEKVDLVAKGAMQSIWAIQQLERMSADKINEYGNLVVGFGGNDLGDKTPEQIIDNYKRIVNLVRSANKKKGGGFKTKIFIVTTPPVGDNPKKLFGNWLSNYARTDNYRKQLNIDIKELKNEGVFDEVIDMAARQEEGGVADNQNPSKIAKGLNYGSDPVHVKPSEYAKRIRFGMYLSEKKEEKNNKNIA